MRVCSKSEVAPGSVKAFAVDDKTLAVYNIDGTFHVTDDECTHAAASLAEAHLSYTHAEAFSQIELLPALLVTSAQAIEKVLHRHVEI